MKKKFGVVFGGGTGRVVVLEIQFHIVTCIRRARDATVYIIREGIRERVQDLLC